ncbi:MAG: hypothetical protein ACJ78Q_03055 [Chloroflexia bacterium]
MSMNPRRNRPNRRVRATQSDEATTLTEEFTGLALAFGSTLLFVGYEVNGLVEIAVYPRYRFSSDDRVQGHLGYVRVPFGTPWETILAEVEVIYGAAEENYRTAVNLRSSELRAHGSQYETAYEAITDMFRESWHGFSLKLNREDQVAKDGAVFSGRPPGPVLVSWRGKSYTVQVFPTGSITMVTSDQQRRLLG